MKVNKCTKDERFPQASSLSFSPHQELIADGNYI